MIQINYMGRLGNNIFQYCVAKLLSEKFNQKIVTTKPDFPFKNDLDIEPKYYQKTISVNDDNFLEIFKLKNIEANLYINGFFQNKSFVLNYKNQIRQMFDMPTDTIEGIALSYRLGDLLLPPFGRVIKHEYYLYCLDKILNQKQQKLYISTDSLNHNLILDLINRYDAEIITDSPANKIIYLSKCTNKVLSLGTFSWWIGFLGNQNNIYYPNKDEYLSWHGDIFVFDEWNKINKQNYILTKEKI